MKPALILAAVLCSALTACLPIKDVMTGSHPAGQTRSQDRVDTDFTLTRMGEFTAQTEKLDERGRQAAIVKLTGRPAPAAVERLELAYLFSLDPATDEELAQAARLLDGLDRLFEDAGVRLYVRLLQRTVGFEAGYARESSRADELEQKLKQIRKLELELIQRNQAPPSPGEPAK